MPAPPPLLPLHIETLGDGPPVLLLHSSGLSGRQWKKLSSQLAQQGFRAILPDLHGHGASPPWLEPKPFSYRQEVETIAAKIRSEGPVHLVGHSYGGLIALLAAVEAPDRVRSMTLFDPVAFGVLHARRDAPALAELTGVVGAWGDSDATHDAWLRGFVDYWGGVGAWSFLREEARAEFRRVGWVIQQGVTTLMTDKTPASAYDVFQFPVTLMTGEQSPIAARTVVDRLVRTIPGAKRVEIPGAGHMAPLAQTDKVNPVVLAAVAAA